jgi:soluble lytic murein transglycosylase-like protein
LIAPAGAFVTYREPVLRAETESAHEQAAVAQARDAVATAWRQGVLDRERLKQSERFAARFRIPLSLADDIHWAARKERIDPHLAFRLVGVESSFRPRAVSPVGALGLTQVMPSTARWLFPGSNRDDLLDARFNLRVGFRYLRRLMDTYGDANLALLAYNRGPARVDSLLNIGEDPGNGYTEAVLTGDRTRHTAFVAARKAAVAAEEARRRAAS